MKSDKSVPMNSTLKHILWAILISILMFTIIGIFGTCDNDKEQREIEEQVINELNEGVYENYHY